MIRKTWRIRGVAAALALTSMVSGADAVLAERTQVTAVSADPATSAYAYLAAFSSTVNEHDPSLQVQALPTRGMIDAARRLRDGDADIALAAEYVFYLMHRGEGGEPQWQDAKLLFRAYPMVMHVMVRDDSPIKTLADAKGHRVGIAQQGNISTILMEATFRAAGVDVQRDTKLSLLSVRDLIDGLRDGTLDIIGYHPSIGAPAIEELASATKVRFIGAPEGIEEKLDEIMPGVLAPMTMPAGSYRGQEEALRTLSGAVAIVASSQLSDEIAYKLVKSFLENRDKAADSLAMIRFTDRELLSRPEAGFLPYHPGALRALQELGYKE